MIKNKIIWQTKPGQETDFEREYLEHILFKDLVVENVFFDGNLSILSERALVVISHNIRKDRYLNLSAYLKKLVEPTLVHLSGENLYPLNEVYSCASTVVRSYYDPRINSNNVFAFPPGFKSGFFNKNQKDFSINNRDLACFFVGEVKNHRAYMLDTLKSIQPHYYHLTKGWNSSAGLSVSDMISYYYRTFFAPCPFGWINPDSFRIMEALECGAIPVSIKFRGIDYFNYVFGDHPFVIGNDWDDAADKIRSFLRNPQLLKEKQEAVKIWYEAYKTDLSRDLASIVRGDIDHLVSRQFIYQREGQRSYRLKWIFTWHFKLEPRITHYYNSLRSELRRLITPSTNRPL